VPLGDPLAWALALIVAGIVVLLAMAFLAGN
jgi:hypothetical protein